MQSKTWRLRSSAQPLVFRFSNASSLFGAISGLYGLDPALKASLCMYRDFYFLAVYSSLSRRGAAARICVPYGLFLGPARVLYSYLEEHGCGISQNAVAELGAALSGLGGK